MLDNGYWFPFRHFFHAVFVHTSRKKIEVLLLYIRTLCEAMVIDSLSLHWGPLRSNGHRFLYIKTLYKAMVIDFLCHIEALCEAMVIDLFTLRPSAKQWSLISLSLHQDPLRDNGHWFLMSHWGPLRGNGPRSLYIKTIYYAMVIDFLCHIEALCEVMVIDLLTSIPSARQWSLFSYVTLRPSARQWSSISLHQDPLRSNDHWFLSFRYRPSPRDWSNMFFEKSEKKIIKQSDLSARDPLYGNGHRIWIFWIDPLHGICLIWFFQKGKKKQKKKTKGLSVSNWDPLLGNGHLVFFFSFRYIPSPLEWSSLSSNLSFFSLKPERN